MSGSVAVGDASPWARALVRISPYTFAAIGIAISIGVSVLGAAWGIYITGSSLIGAAIKAPRITSKNLIRRGKFSSPGQAAAVSALWRENFGGSDLPLHFNYGKADVFFHLLKC